MLLTAKTLKDEKIKYYIAQNGKCALCGHDLDEDIMKNHLDHDHSLDGNNSGKIRSLLCIHCNPLEGILKHKFNSSGLKQKIEMVEWMKNLINYYESDFSKNNIHPKFVNDKIKKFKTLNKPEMIEELNAINIFPDKSTKEELISIFKKEYRKFLKAKIL